MRMAQTTTEKTAAAPGPARQRSPNFPAISLPEALKRIKTIYENDRRNPVSEVVMLEHLGYGKRVSGSAGRMLSALRQYGLLDETADDKYRVSEDAYYILTLAEDSEKRWEAIAKAATKPATFREILHKWKDGLPSDSSLRDYLIVERGFNPASVENFIRALKGTIEFAKLYSESYNAAVGSDAVESDAVADERPAEVRDRKQSVRPHGDEFIEQRLTADCKVEMTFRGRVTQQAIEKLRRLLDLQKDAYPVDEPSQA